MGWTCGKNGRGTVDEESGCAWSGGRQRERDLAGVGGEWKLRARVGGVETGGGDGSETALVMKKI